MFGRTTFLIRYCRLSVSTIAFLIALNSLTGCTDFDNLQKTHEVLATLQEADRQISIESTPVGTLPDDRNAITWINRAIALMPHSVVPYLGDADNPGGLVSLLENRGRYPLLVTLLKKAILDPALSDNPEILVALGDAEQQSGLSAEATATYAKAVAAFNRTLSTAGSTISTDDSSLMDKAQAEYYGGMKPQGVKDFESIIATTDGDLRATAQNNLAYFLSLDKTDLPHAKDLASAAVSTAGSEGNNDELGIYDDTLAWVLHQQGDEKHALFCEEEAASLDPLQPDIQFHLGEICSNCGKNLEARIAYQRAIKLDPFNSQARASLASLPPAKTG